MSTGRVVARPARAALRPGSTPRFVLAAATVVALVRLTYLPLPLRADEGGYLLLARQWHAGGEFLYGDYSLDRPPLLLLLFRIAALTEWDGAIRLLSIPFAVAFVLLAGRAGWLLGGGAGARWASALGAALIVSPALAADQADGGLFAAPLVLAAMTATLEARRRLLSGDPRGAAVAAGLAGLAASAAPMVKQSLLDGWVFACALGAVLLLRRRSQPVEGAAPSGLALLFGGLVPPLLLLGWATAAGIPLAQLWAELGAVRGGALSAILSASTEAPVRRGLQLAALALLSGLVPVLAAGFRARRRGPAPEVTAALVAATVYGVLGIVAGGSFWPHYLLQLAPVAVLWAAGTAVRSEGVRASVWWSLGSAAAAYLVLVTATLAVPWVGFYRATGHWLAESSEPGDSVFVAYGHPAILEYAGLGSPYPHLWSLPMRTLDADQTRLERTLRGPDAPEWLVEVNDWNSWDIDADGRLRDVVERRYRVVAEVCGSPVWLRADVTRQLAVPPRC